MSMINYASREINCKIVYYGSGLGGKPTHLEPGHGKVKPDTRAKLLALAAAPGPKLLLHLPPMGT